MWCWNLKCDLLLDTYIRVWIHSQRWRRSELLYCWTCSSRTNRCLVSEHHLGSARALCVSEVTIFSRQVLTGLWAVNLPQSFLVSGCAPPVPCCDVLDVKDDLTAPLLKFSWACTLVFVTCLVLMAVLRVTLILFKKKKMHSQTYLHTHTQTKLI